MTALTRWDPFRELSTLHRQVDELFRRSFAEMPGLGSLFGESADHPQVESYVKDDEWVVKASLPGVDPKAVEVSLAGDRLTLRGERKDDKEVRDEDYLVREIRYGSFERTLRVPEGVETEQIRASMEDGMLTITAPIKAESRARKIPVEAAGSAKEAKAA